MSENEDPKDPLIKPRVEKTLAPGFLSVYANSAQIRMGSFDVQISFGLSSIEDDEDDNDVVKMEENIRIMMSPQHAKALLRLLGAHLKRYERAFGEINIQPKTQVQEDSKPETAETSTAPPAKSKKP